MTNSISTIFTLDIFPSLNKGENAANPVRVGRIVALAAMVIAMIAARPLLGNFDQAFQYIQEFTGFFTPGIVVIFMLGIFYAKTTATAALAAAISSAVFSFLFSVLAPELPFIDRVGVVFLLCAGLAIGISHLWPKSQGGAVELSEVSFATSTGFNLSALLVTLILCAFYITWW
jgi:SSS family solute:Na+ symporter